MGTNSRVFSKNAKENAVYNKVMLVGRLARDPELKEFSNGGAVCKIRLITSSSWKDRETGEMKERTEGHNVVVSIDSVARRIAVACHKGEIVLIEGAIETRKYDGPEGKPRYITEIVIRSGQGRVRRMPTPSRSTDTGANAAVALDAAPATIYDPLADHDVDVFDDMLGDDMESFGDGDDAFPF